MPNWVKNVMRYDGDKHLVERMLEEVKNDELGIGTIDFNKLIPMPSDVFCGPLGPQERKQYGDRNWYDWSIANWGTKWNAAQQRPHSVTLDSSVIEFWTAWSAPVPVYRAISQKYPRIHFEFSWADEDVGSENCGKVMLCNGEVEDSCLPTGDDAVDFASELWNLNRGEEDE